MTSGGPRSRWVDIGIPVHYLDFGGPDDGPVVVAVHGLAGAAVNWLAVAPLLAGRCRVLALDLAGHGLTQTRGHPTSVSANRALVHRFVTAVAGDPVILMGNSMGGMIALLEAGTEPDMVAGLILLAPALPFLPAIPDPLVAAAFAVCTAPVFGRALMPQWRRLPPERVVAEALRFCCTDPSRVPDRVVAEHVRVTRRRANFADAGSDLLQAARSMIFTAGGGGWRNPYRRAIRAVRGPVLIVHGEQDRFTPVAASRDIVRCNPSWQLTVLPGIGHVPQLEAPEETASVVTRWLDGFGAASARSAAHPLVDQESAWVLG